MNKLMMMAASCCLAGTITAQRYVNSVAGISGGAMNEVVQCQWNTSSNNPTVLMAKSSGFALVNFNEANGSMTTGNGITLDNGTLSFYKPVAMAQVGVNEFVVGQDRNNIYYVLANASSGAVIYKSSFPKTYTGQFFSWQDASAVDVVYDGSQYCYLLMNSVFSGNTCASVAKIDALTGNVTYFISNGANFSYSELANDIEYVDNSHIYISGTRTQAGQTEFLVFNIFSVNNGRSINYNTSTLSPAHCYVKASGTTLWLFGDMNNTLNSTSPVVLMKLTDNGSSITLNSANTLSYLVGNIVSLHRSGNYITLGTVNATHSLPQILLYNTSTSSVVDCSSYSTSGSNVYPQVTYSPSSQRIFSALCDNSVNIIYNLRTDVNSTATYCNTAISISPKVLTVPNSVASLAWKVGDGVRMQNLASVVAYSLSATGQCLPFAANSPGDFGDGSSSAARMTTAVVAPNPASDLVSISAAEEKEISSIEIYSVTGQLLQTVSSSNAATVTVSTSSLENGIYLFVIRNADGTVENKNVVVNH